MNEHVTLCNGVAHQCVLNSSGGNNEALWHTGIRYIRLWVLDNSLLVSQINSLLVLVYWWDLLTVKKKAYISRHIL